MADAPKKITLKSTDTSRFKLSPPLPPGSAEGEKTPVADGGASAADTQMGGAATAAISDPLASRETNTAKMKRVQLMPPRPGEAASAATTVAKKGESTDTVTLKVVRDKKKDMGAGGLASQTVRLRPPSLTMEGNTLKITAPPPPEAPVLEADDTTAAPLVVPSAERPASAPRETVRLTLPPTGKSDSMSAATQAVMPEEKRLSTATATIKLKPIMKPKPAPQGSAPEAVAATVAARLPSLSLKTTSSQTITLKPAAAAATAAAPTGPASAPTAPAPAETQAAATLEPPRQTLKVKLPAAPGETAQAQETVSLKESEAGAPSETVQLPAGGADTGPTKRTLKLKGSGKKTIEAAAAAAEGAGEGAYGAPMLQPPPMAESTTGDEVGILTLAASLLTVVALGALTYFLAIQAMAYVF